LPLLFREKKIINLLKYDCHPFYVYLVSSLHLNRAFCYTHSLLLPTHYLYGFLLHLFILSIQLDVAQPFHSLPSPLLLIFSFIHILLLKLILPECMNFISFLLLRLRLIKYFSSQKDIKKLLADFQLYFFFRLLLKLGSGILLHISRSLIFRVIQKKYKRRIHST
jgi:hypothetical protein